MKRITLIALVLWPTTPRAQSEALMQAYRQGQALFQAGRYGEAIAFYERALALAEQEFGPEHTTTATLLNDLAELYRVQGRIAEAGPLYERALAIKEMTLGPDHPDVVASLSNLAGLYESRGRTAEAEVLYARVLEIAQVAGEAWPPGPAASRRSDVYETLNNASVRAAPTMDGTRLMIPAKGTEVELLERVADDTWYRVAERGRPIGFIFAPLLRNVMPPWPLSFPAAGWTNRRRPRPGRGS